MTSGKEKTSKTFLLNEPTKSALIHHSMGDKIQIYLNVCSNYAWAGVHKLDFGGSARF